MFSTGRLNPEVPYPSYKIFTKKIPLSGGVSTYIFCKKTDFIDKEAVFLQPVHL